MPAYKLNQVQLFYIEHHYEKMSAKDLALELDVPYQAVQAAIRKIRAERKKSEEALAVTVEVAAKEPTLPPPMMHEARGGSTVSMTEAASAMGDEAMKRVQTGSRHPRYARCLGKIDPDKPSQ